MTDLTTPEETAHPASMREPAVVFRNPGGDAFDDADAFAAFLDDLSEIGLVRVGGEIWPTGEPPGLYDVDVEVTTRDEDGVDEIWAEYEDHAVALAPPEPADDERERDVPDDDVEEELDREVAECVHSVMKDNPGMGKSEAVAVCRDTVRGDAETLGDVPLSAEALDELARESGSLGAYPTVWTDGETHVWRIEHDGE